MRSIQKIKAEMKRAEENGNTNDELVLNYELAEIREKLDEWWHNLMPERQEEIYTTERENLKALLPDAKRADEFHTLRPDEMKIVKNCNVPPICNVRQQEEKRDTPIAEFPLQIQTNSDRQNQKRLMEDTPYNNP